MDDGLYAHTLWDGLVVEIKDNCIVEIVTEPGLPVQMPAWKDIRHWWDYVIQDRRPLSDEEFGYFTKI